MLCLTVSEAGSHTPRCQQGRCPRRAGRDKLLQVPLLLTSAGLGHSWACRWHPPEALLRPLSAHTCQSVRISSLFKNASHIGLGTALMSSSYFKHLQIPCFQMGSQSQVLGAGTPTYFEGDMSQLITHRYSMFLFIRAFLKTSKVFVINFSKGKTTVEDPVEGLEALRRLSFNIVSSFLFSVFSLTFPLQGFPEFPARLVSCLSGVGHGALGNFRCKITAHI